MARGVNGTSDDYHQRMSVSVAAPPRLRGQIRNITQIVQPLEQWAGAEVKSGEQLLAVIEKLV
jgi:hypothetical protein